MIGFQPKLNILRVYLQMKVESVMMQSREECLSLSGGSLGTGITMHLLFGNLTLCNT